ncbi:hypothetical protein PCL_06018 [Purpureocillium lilacinum]|uniref:Protein ras-2 n=1 Tax=Purpureocillium lilacinum TaxID=33203 RepID=A0A2U3ELP0_PURLI|nr:hypothetical protein PCL_06018 [Purpureocillium lilacinum]
MCGSDPRKDGATGRRRRVGEAKMDRLMPDLDIHGNSRGGPLLLVPSGRPFVGLLSLLRRRGGYGWFVVADWLRTEDLSWNRPQADDARRAGPVSATPARATCGNVEHNTTGSDPQPDAPVSNIAWPRPLDPSSSSLGYPLGPRPVTARYLGASTGPWKAPRVVGSSSQPPSRPADRTQPSSGRASRGPLAGEHKHWIPMGLKQQRPGKLESSMTHRASKHGTGELQRPAEGPARAEGPVDTSNMEDQAPNPTVVAVSTEYLLRYVQEGATAAPAAQADAVVQMDGRAPNQPPPGKRHASLSFNRLQKNIGMRTSSTPTRQMVQDASLASHFVGPRWWWWQALAAILAPWIPALVPGVRPRCSSPAAVAEALAAPRASASPSAASQCRTADARVTNARLQHRSLPDAVLQRAGSVVGRNREGYLRCYILDPRFMLACAVQRAMTGATRHGARIGHVAAGSSTAIRPKPGRQPPKPSGRQRQSKNPTNLDADESSAALQRALRMTRAHARSYARTLGLRTRTAPTSSPSPAPASHPWMDLRSCLIRSGPVPIQSTPILADPKASRPPPPPLFFSLPLAAGSTSTVHQQQPWPDLLALPLSPSALVTPPEEPDRQPETDGQAAQRNSSEQQRTRASPPPRAPARPTGGFLFPIFFARPVLDRSSARSSTTNHRSLIRLSSRVSTGCWRAFSALRSRTRSQPTFSTPTLSRLLLLSTSRPRSSVAFAAAPLLRLSSSSSSASASASSKHRSSVAPPQRISSPCRRTRNSFHPQLASREERFVCSAAMAGRMVLYKLVVLGDGGVGKTALTIQLCLQHFVETYDPTIEDSYRKQVVIDGQPCMLEVLDTAGQEEYTALRDQWIRDGEGFVLVYSISSRSSFTRIKRFHHQIQRVKESCASSPSYPGSPISAASPQLPVPIMLVGNKSDRVTEREVSTQEGHALARELGCEFVEASAKNCINVEKAFYDVVRILRRQRQQASRPPAGSSGRSRTGNGDIGGREREAPRYRRGKDGEKSKSKCVVL